MSGGRQGGARATRRLDWRTPHHLFRQLDDEFHFTLDVAASPRNFLCERYFTEKDDGLKQDWRPGPVWCNPPYGQREIDKWVGAAWGRAVLHGVTTVMLLPARVDSGWFHRWIYGREHVEVRFIRGRLKFGGPNSTSAPFPSMIVVFRPPRPSAAQ